MTNAVELSNELQEFWSQLDHVMVVTPTEKLAGEIQAVLKSYKHLVHLIEADVASNSDHQQLLDTAICNSV